MMKLLLLVLQLVLLNEAKTLGSALKLSKTLESALEDASFNVQTHVHLPTRNNTVRQHCPAIGDLPIVTSNRKEFYGIRFYQDKGHAVPDLSCNGYYFDEVSGYRYSAPGNAAVPMGTLYVHAGCKFYGFLDHNYEGSYKEYTGPLFLSEGPNGLLDCGVPCPSSYIVTCTQQMPDCVPEDKWSTVASYDNTGSSLTSTFTYRYTIGTSWSHEMSQKE